MRRGLPRRMHELQQAVHLLQGLGWVLTSINVGAEDDGDRGMVPVGSLVFRYDPEKPTDRI